MDIPFYPVNEFGPAMKGMVIGGLGIFHVFLAQFAIGGGILLCYFQWLAQTGRSPITRKFVDGYFKVLVLISFVVGALTGVGMWLTTIQISPRTIGIMVQEFHWIWATEWTFFSLEVASGYCFYRYGKRLNDATRLMLLAVYSTAAWFSLFWINGILAWQLTPGGWLENQNVWSGFFNATFWPSLFFRTISSMATAALVACVVVNLTAFTREEKTELINKAAHLFLPMVLMLPLGVWFLMAMPPDSRSWVLGGSIAMTLFLNLGIVCSILIGGYALIGLYRQKLYINGATATLLCALGMMATAGAEFVREGVRKPYTVREYLYSNSLTEQEVAALRATGSIRYDPYPLRDEDQYPTRQLQTGAKVYRIQCSVCHTIDGANGLTHLTSTWTPSQLRLNIAQLQRTKPFMPPFAGTAKEVEAIVQFIQWNLAGRPEEWERKFEPAVIREIEKHLDEVGTKPGIHIAAKHSGKATGK